MSELRVLGIDPGAKYFAWATVIGDSDNGFLLERHGILYPPALGETTNYGKKLRLWEWLVEACLRDFKADVIGIERFVYTPGGRGKSAEPINLQIPAVCRHGAELIRNTDWKSYFKKHIHAEGTEDYFGLATPHECDAAGVALYTAAKFLKG